jgi:hypothetical protein
MSILAKNRIKERKMQNGLTRQQIRKAAKWWREQLENPTFDAGANDPHMVMATVLANMLAEKHEPDDGRLDVFERELRRALARETRYISSLSVDYHPGPILRDAADRAGIDHSRFPWKTRMSFRDGKVLVSLGYGASQVEI